MKKVEDNTKLPQFFDLMWDCKEGWQLKDLDKKDLPEVRRVLAEHGFDANAWAKEL